VLYGIEALAAECVIAVGATFTATSSINGIGGDSDEETSDSKEEKESKETQSQMMLQILGEMEKH